jgi:hypothetical protein
MCSDRPETTISSDVGSSQKRSVEHSKLPVLYRFLQVIQFLDVVVEGVVCIDIGREHLAKQIEVFQIQRLAVSRYDVLDGQYVEGVDFGHNVRFCVQVTRERYLVYVGSPSEPRLWPGSV